MKSEILFGVWAVAIFLMLFGSEANGAWDQSTLAGKLKVVSPASGIQKLEIVKSDSGNLFGVVAHYQGAPLPAEKSIILEMDPPPVRRAFSVHILSRDPYWTQPFWPDSLSDLPALSQFALWEEGEGKFGAMISLAGGGMNSRLEGAGAKLRIVSESRANDFAPARVPVLALGWSDDPYQLIQELYRFGFKVMKEIDPQGVIGKLRVDKPYPEIFRYVGWCSWNTYYTRVDEKKLIQSAKSFQQSGFPIRWIIIDDGWQPIAETVPVAHPGRKYSLTGFEANPKKFPDGLGHTIRIIKQDYGIKWVGVWHTFQGYWNGVALDSELGRKYRDALLPVSDQVGIPDPRGNAGEKFWDGYYQFLSGAGVDFVKTDNQSELAWYLRGAMPASLAMANAQRNHKSGAEKYLGLNVLDCMGMNLDTVYQWEKTNLSRASNDFYPAGFSDPRRHTVKCIMNSLWFQNLTYPDFDMWMTHDNYAVYHSVTRAMGGGPVYLTDKPGRHHWDLVWPLVYADGEVIRLDAPGLPGAQSLFEDPYLSGKPLIAFGRSGESGILAAWNVDKKYRSVTAELSPRDVYGIKGDKFAVYDYFSGKVSALARNEKFKVKMGSWEVRLYSVVPIPPGRDGFAPIGLVNKYISPATISEFNQEPGKITVILKEAGTFAAYCEKKPKQVKLNGSLLSDQLMEYSGNLLKVKLIGLTDGQPPVKLDFVW